jgi:hypothetical protein
MTEPVAPTTLTAAAVVRAVRDTRFARGTPGAWQCVPETVQTMAETAAGLSAVVERIDGVRGWTPYADPILHGAVLEAVGTLRAAWSQAVHALAGAAQLAVELASDGRQPVIEVLAWTQGHNAQLGAGWPERIASILARLDLPHVQAALGWIEICQQADADLSVLAGQPEHSECSDPDLGRSCEQEEALGARAEELPYAMAAYAYALCHALTTMPLPTVRRSGGPRAGD